MANLEYGIGSIGGFCVGSSYIVEHQTLAGLGYCFSASLPPMLAAGALKAVEILENNPMIITDLRSKAELVHDNFNDLKVINYMYNYCTVVNFLKQKKNAKIFSFASVCPTFFILGTETFWRYQKSCKAFTNIRK